MKFEISLNSRKIAVNPRDLKKLLAVKDPKKLHEEAGKVLETAFSFVYTRVYNRYGSRPQWMDNNDIVISVLGFAINVAALLEARASYLLAEGRRRKLGNRRRKKKRLIR